MIDLLLVNPAVFDLNGPNLGLGYIAESARQSGYSVSLYDANNRLYGMCDNDDKRNLWKVKNQPYWTERKYHGETQVILHDELEQCFEDICNLPSKYIGFFSSRTTYNNAVDFASRIKKKFGSERKIIFGGYDCHTRRVVELKLGHVEDIDHIVVGEGEQAIVEILQGIRDGQRIIEGTSAPQLDDYNWPTYAEVDWERTPRRTLIMGSRGCPWSKCTICPDKFGGKYQTRSGKNIFDEIYHHFHTNSIKIFSISDPVFNGRKKVIDELCSLIIESDIEGIAIDAQSSFIYKVTPSSAEQLRRAGFSYILFGFESGSQKIVDQMNKGYNMEVATQTVRILHQAGISVGLNVLVGFPSETEEDFSLTKRFLTENKEAISRVHENNHFRIYTENSDCGVNVVFENPSHYGIAPSTLSEENWVSQEGDLTLEVRKRRVDEINQLCDELGIGKSYKLDG